MTHEEGVVVWWPAGTSRQGQRTMVPSEPAAALQGQPSSCGCCRERQMGEMQWAPRPELVLIMRLC